ncbi:hypothetical protein HmCmsJML267_03868 [Escherichia coli]|nr:hypothetical protein HmCmsJML081_03641 [Escherichia coli]GDE44799.1 hypothetical protein HmCmsJML267_03868 [Escherichia coli]
MGDFLGLCVLPDAMLMGDAHLIELNKTYTKNIDLRHIFALYRKLATVKEVLL